MKKRKWLNKRRWMRVAIRKMARRPDAPSRLRCFRLPDNEALMIGKPVGKKPVQTIVLLFPYSGQTPDAPLEVWPPPIANPFKTMRAMSAGHQMRFLLKSLWLGRPRLPIIRLAEALLP